MITPQIHISTGITGEKVEFYKTYHKHLLKDLPNVFNKYGVKTVLVIRSRRGEWGEWCERWEMDYRQVPFITKKGWS